MKKKKLCPLKIQSFVISEKQELLTMKGGTLENTDDPFSIIFDCVDKPEKVTGLPVVCELASAADIC
ncbi:MAG: hypothetical protein WBA74_06925 [Cyclobacteriaceae bacterium]